MNVKITMPDGEVVDAFISQHCEGTKTYRLVIEDEDDNVFVEAEYQKARQQAYRELRDETAR